MNAFLPKLPSFNNYKYPQLGKKKSHIPSFGSFTIYNDFSLLFYTNVRKNTVLLPAVLTEVFHGYATSTPVRYIDKGPGYYLHLPCSQKSFRREAPSIQPVTGLCQGYLMHGKVNDINIRQRGKVFTTKIRDTYS